MCVAVVTTLAGSGAVGFNNGVGTVATFNGPTFLAVSTYIVYVSDSLNNLIRTVSLYGELVHSGSSLLI